MQMTLSDYLTAKASLRARCMALRAAHPGLPVRDLPEPEYRAWCSLQQQLDDLESVLIVDGDPDTTESAATAARGEAPPPADKVLPAATADGATL